MAAYAGLTPRQRSSGFLVHGKPALSKVGNARLRKALFLPAMAARRFNSLIAALYERLLAKGKVKKQVIGAVMRKLLYLAYAILKSDKPFDRIMGRLPLDIQHSICGVALCAKRAI